jgi:hypothetical protein
VASPATAPLPSTVPANLPNRPSPLFDNPESSPAMPTINGIEYVHLVENFVKGIDDRGPWYRCQYYIDNYSDSDTFANALVGIGTATQPHRHQLSQNVVATNPVVIGQGTPILNADGLPSDYTEGAVVEVIYRASTLQGILTQATDDPNNYEQIFDPSGQPVLYCTQEIDYGVEIVTIPNNSYIWSTGLTRANVPVKVEVAITTLTLTFHRIRLIPTGLIRSCRGKVNGPGPQITSPSLILPANTSGIFLGAPRGQVLFQGARTSREVASNGQVSRKLSMVFVERDHPWGTFLRPDSLETWDYLEDNSGKRMYKEQDFRGLLYFAQLV